MRRPWMGLSGRSSVLVEELRANACEHFLFLSAAWKHAANTASVLILGYLLNRFRGE